MPHEPLDERGKRGDTRERRLAVHGTQLDGPELRVEAHLPPHERVVLELARFHCRPYDLLVVAPIPERWRDLHPREAPAQHTAGARKAGVAPMPERRVPRERL